MSDLIERLIQATEGSRELDEAIAIYTGWFYRAHWAVKEKWIRPNGWKCRKPYTFTTSLDAALTLVPEGRWLHLEQFAGATGSGKSAWHARLYDAKATEVYGMGFTPALALCIASLKARTHERRGE